MTLSTTEAEYMTLTSAPKESIWLKGLVGELGILREVATVYCDSLSAICLEKDQVHNVRTKHIGVEYHFLLTDKRVKVKKIRTADIPTYFLTKFIPFGMFKHCLDLLNIDYYVM